MAQCSGYSGSPSAAAVVVVEDTYSDWPVAVILVPEGVLAFEEVADDMDSFCVAKEWEHDVIRVPPETASSAVAADEDAFVETVAVAETTAVT